VWAGGWWSYRRLDDEVERLAALLRRRGVGPESVVAVAVDRSPELIAALLAVHRAGGAYLPLDADHPEERLRLLLADAGVRWLVADGGRRERVAGPAADAGVEILHVGDLQPASTSLPSAPGRGAGGEGISEAMSDKHLAYLIYTSGSTGRPKGVQVGHRSLAHYVRGARERYRLGAGDRILQFAAATFDASVEEIFPALTAGAAVVLRSGSGVPAVADLLAEVAERRVTVLPLPTAYWHEWVATTGAEPPATVRTVILGGEEAAAGAVDDWRRSGVTAGVRLINSYGPTEATVVRDLEGAARRIADFLDLPLDRDRLHRAVERSRPAALVEHDRLFDPRRHHLAPAPAERFIRKGRSGDGRGAFTPRQEAELERRLRSLARRLGVDPEDPLADLFTLRR